MARFINGLNNKSVNFILLRKILYILVLTIAISLNGFAQERPVTDPSNAINKIIKFYPNPATSIINFDLQRDYNNSFSLLIFNFMGKKVYEVKSTSTRMSINLDEFYRGIYIFQLRDKNGNITESGKFQVVK